MAQWRAEGRPISTHIPDVAPGEFIATRRDALFCHVAGFKRALASGVQRILPEVELRQVVEAAGVDSRAPSVAACSLGVGAAAAAFILHLLGNSNVALFDGSWEAWSTRDDAHPG